MRSTAAAAAPSSRRARKSSVLAIAIPLALIALLTALPASGAKPQYALTTVSPVDGATVSGGVRWEVAANGGAPNRVEFSVDGTLLWTEHDAPYAFKGASGTLDTTTLSNGWHTLTATAYGPKAQTSIRIMVTNESAPPPPTLQISTLSPADGQKLSGQVRWEVGVSGETPTKVDFEIDGTVRWTENNAPYAFNGNTGTLDTTTLADGVHTLKATAYASGVSKSAAIAVTVANTTDSGTAPLNTVAPAVSGAAVVGATLTATAGTWTGTLPMTYSHEWRRCDSAGSNCTAITGATAGSYVVQATDEGRTLRAAVVAKNSAGSTTALSAATAAVQNTTTTTTTTLGSKLPARMPESSGRGGVYYVDGTNGSDSSSGNSSAPWRTINKALASVPLAGSIIKVRPGTYSSSGTSYVITFRRLASTSDPVTLQAETPGTVRIANAQPGNWTLGAWIVNASGLRVRGLTFRLGYIEGSNAAAGALLVEDSDRIEITGNTFYEDPGIAVSVRGGVLNGETADDVWILGNVFRSSTSNVYAKVTGMSFGSAEYFGSKGSHWIYAGQYGTSDTWDKQNGSRRLVIANNVFTGSAAGRHVQIGPQARDGFIVNNTFFGNRAISVIGASTGARYAGGGVEFFANSSNDSYKTGNNVVTNNLFADLDGHAAYGSGPSEPGNVVQNNLAFNLANGMGYQGSTTADYLATYGTTCCLFSTGAGNRSNADPRFLNPAGFDFRLGTASPAIGAGDPAYSVPYDYTGKLRDGAPDLGAFES